MKTKALKKLLAILFSVTVSISTLPLEGMISYAESVSDGITEHSSQTMTVTDVLSGDTNRDGIVDSADSEELLAAVKARSTNGIMQSDVDGDGIISQADVDMIAAYASGEIDYFPIGVYYSSDAAYVTRGEWMHTLVTLFDMQVEDESTVYEYFSDVNGNVYADDINLTANFGVFDIDSETFVPDAYVSREFMAHTLNYCVGFAEETSVSFSDYDDVVYAGDAQTAVQQGWLALQDGKFMPDLYMTKSEADNAVKDVELILDEAEFDENYESVIETDDSVIELESTAETTLSGDTVIITGSKKKLSEGDTFSFYLEDNLFIRKVVSIETDSSGTMTVETTFPDDETVTSVDSMEYGYIDYDNIEILNDNFDIQVEDVEAPISAYNSKERIGGTINVNTKNLKISSKQFDLGGGKVSISGGISDLKVPYIIQTKLGKVEKLKIGVDAKADITAKFTTEMKSSSGDIPIAKFNIWSCGVAKIALTMSISISVKGEISVNYSCAANSYVEYTSKNGWRNDKSFKTTKFVLEASVEEKMGVKLALEVHAIGKKLGECYFMVGEQGKAVAKLYPSGFTCMDISAYMVAELGVNFSTPKFKKTWTLINEKNSPFYYHAHYDNNKKVSGCTYGSTKDGYIGSTTSDGGKVSNTGRVVYSGKAGNIKKTSGTHVTACTNTYSTYTQFFAELDPPVYITENTTLEEDMTVNNDLYVQDYINLNGRTLEVNGNVYHSSGEIYINNGALNINGNYYMEDSTTDSNGKRDYFECSAELTMKGLRDRVNIKGDFTTHNLQESWSAVDLDTGKLSVGGNIWSDGGINSYESSNRIVLNGTGTQKVYTVGKWNWFHEVEVTNPSKRTIIYGGNLRIEKLVSDINIKSDNLNLSMLNLNQNKMTINGDVVMEEGSDSVNLNGGTLTINGNLLQRGSQLSCNNGTLDVNGNYAMEYVKTNSDGEKEYFECTAKLTMSNIRDRVNVSGNFTTHNLVNWRAVYLNKGILSVGGDIWSDGNIISYESSNRVILNGAGTQKVYTTGDSYFYELEVINPSKRTIIYGGKLRIEYLASDINIKSNSLILGSLNLNGNNMTINGDVTIEDASYGINLNEGVLTINGNLLQRDSQIKCNNGTLNVNGNYSMEYQSAYNEYQECNAQLFMNNMRDKVNISGNFTMHNLYYNSNAVNLNKGTLFVGGDIWSDGGIKSGYNSHKTILASDKKQNITLNKSDKFDILVLTKPISNYKFNPDECWNSLITVGNGDVNFDNDITIADVVLLQKYLVRKEFFNKAQLIISDMNNDEKVDVFDVIILKRKLLI